ncbi:hypothetical protein A2996_03095 [Candidatus Campbellbacteria bacterium RIFCSPLOWO2_01_FULL_34_15]|uniref:Digeranylgeranylglyceryl phosphate synthase n=2 Tax=Candidatus Campbelliibacteriota TaxID=1752727 RepID=A0A1F5EM78_9BACT|nr:MAG: hypothetical protein A2996_03095 [Candidatus Campbellbacteria bacterium RIFCSPLOWO2_01_FULL_34_15]OGD69013.1 MAG: hypothetical protein A2811_00010 [Candidatus Campbellbacteria bacterium RIFCSPHIGHO2_01_FULL_34_10]
MKKILNFFENSINYIENKNITILSIFFSVYLASILRSFLEGYTNSLNNKQISGLIDTFFHYPLWFLGVFLGIIIVLFVLTKEKIEKITKLFVYVPFVVVIPIFFDLFLKKENVSYSFITSKFDNAFLTLGGDFISNGIKLEIIIASIFIFIYVYLKTKKIWKAILGSFFSYVVIFTFLTLPVFLQNSFEFVKNEKENFPTGYFYRSDHIKSNFSEKNLIFSGNSTSLNNDFFLENQTSIIFSTTLLFVDICLICLIFFFYNRKKFFSVIKNFRYLRIVYYFIFVSFGIFLSGGIPISLFDYILIFSTFSSLFFAWLFCVWENDEVDLDIDRISNKKRPLPQGDISVEEWKIIKYFFLVFSLGFAFLSGFYVFLLVLIYISLYHIYSVPPLRLKKVIILSSLVVAINALIAVWLGYFVSSNTEYITEFPPKIILFVIMVVFFVENIKNIKDIEGDKKNNIKTLANILGERNSKLIFGLIASLFIFLAPFVFYFSLKTIIVSTFFSVVMYLSINKKIFNENHIFLIYFVFIAFFVLAVLL